MRTLSEIRTLSPGMMRAKEQPEGPHLQEEPVKSTGIRWIRYDERARTLETIHISAGERGIELALKTSDLIAISGGTYVKATDG